MNFNSLFCANCNQPSLTYDETGGCFVCQECGVVSGQEKFSEEVEFIKSGSIRGVEGHNVSFYEGEGGGLATMSTATLKQLNYSGMKERRLMIAKKRANEKIELVLESISLGKHYGQEIWGLVEQMVSSRGKYTKEKWLEKVICCCAYIIAREHKVAVTFHDVAKGMNISLKKLAKVYKDIIQEYKNITGRSVSPAGPIELLLRFSEKPEFIVALGTRTKEVCEGAIKLIEVAKSEWLDCGRKPAAIASAALKIVADSKNIELDFDTISQLTGCGQVSIRERCKELKTMLITFASELPWGQHIDDKNINAHLPFLLHHLTSLHDLKRKGNVKQSNTIIPNKEKTTTKKKNIPKTNPFVKKRTRKQYLVGNDQSLPPSYIRNLQERERRRQKIEAAKKRIIACFMPGAQDRPLSKDDLDEEDLEIERLILNGVPDEELERGYYHKPLNITEPISNSVELTEKDMGEEEEKLYIKPKEETDAVKALKERFKSLFPEEEEEEIRQVRLAKKRKESAEFNKDFEIKSEVKEEIKEVKKEEIHNDFNFDNEDEPKPKKQKTFL